MRPIDPKYYYRNFIHPRYWGTWFAILILFLISLLPYRGKLSLGRWLGGLQYKYGKSRRQAAETNVKACFPELTDQERDELVYENCVSVATGYMESTIAWFGNPQPFIDKLEVHGREHLEEAKARGKGVILIGAHFSIIDFAGPLVHSVEPFNYMYRPQNNPLLNALVERARRKYSNKDFTKREIKPMLEFIKQGNVVWYAPDQDSSPEHSVFAPFFGVATSTLTTPAWLARETGATVLHLSQYREKGGVYSVYYSPIVEDYPGEDEVENATRLNQGLETDIKRHPEQYLWLHRRFKHRPEGEPPFYPPKKKKRKKANDDSTYRLRWGRYG
jgi:KDO2-lipid IV(A) lauroyltransferase